MAASHDGRNLGPSRALCPARGCYGREKAGPMFSRTSVRQPIYASSGSAFRPSRPRTFAASIVRIASRSNERMEVNAGVEEGNKDERVAHVSTPSRMAELQGTCGSAVLCRCIRMTKGRRRGRKQERGRRLSRKADCRVSFIPLFLRAGSLSTDQTTVFILCMRDGKVSESLTSNFEPLAVRMMSGSLG